MDDQTNPTGVDGNITSLADAPRSSTTPRSTNQRKKKQTCRFFTSKGGCRAGDACPFPHPNPSGASDPPPQPVKAAKSSATAAPKRQYAPPAVNQSRVVARPVPRAQVEDPREFQLGQIRRRFTPTEESTPSEDVFKLKLAPSDPDFPFDLPFLECVLTVPSAYPKDGKPSLRITNKEMPRGFQLNVEKGFDQIFAESPDATLLGIFNRLDKRLETLLSGEKAETVKIVRNAQKPEPQVQKVTPVVIKAPAPQPSTTVPRASPVPQFTAEQKSQAQQKRQADIRQLVARLGRLPGFIQASDGVTFTLPFQPSKKAALPQSLQMQKTFKLIVPESYNLATHPPRIEITGNNDSAAKALESSFQERAKDGLDQNLLSHINYMTANAHTMAIPKPSSEPKLPEQVITEPVKSEIVVPVMSKASGNDAEPDRSHIHIIARPPEWSNDPEHDDWSSDETFSDDSDDDSQDETTEDNGQMSAPISGVAERGIMMSFPNMDLFGCELLELVSLNVTVKCERCKDLLDVQRLRNNTKGDASGMRDESCKKCANALAVGFRADLLHQNSVRAGYLDLDGCTVVDMLPSNFLPTCTECSTTYSEPGLVAVRGDSTLANCRLCHRRMSFRIPEIRFLQVSASAVRASRAPVRRKVKENLGIVAGQELPRRGRCQHYGKSYRWFRFSCCSKVYPCDRCHDEKESHPNEHANRMLCGYCSREQNYHPENCHICRAVLTGKTGSGFWEGGKGTRDKSRMSKKDPRKYKRRPATKPRS